MREENNEVLKYLCFDIALYAVFTEFHVFGILLSVMSVGKKGSGKLLYFEFYYNSTQNRLSIQQTT